MKPRLGLSTMSFHLKWVLLRDVLWTIDPKRTSPMILLYPCYVRSFLLLLVRHLLLVAMHLFLVASCYYIVAMASNLLAMAST